jgi:PAS domain S-box-containing protein
MHFKDPAEEIKHLQRCMSDLVAVLALPAIWTGQEPRHIVSTLRDALMATLNLDFLSTFARTEAGGEPFEVSETAPHSPPLLVADEITKAVYARFGNDREKWPSEMRIHLGGREISLIVLRLGIAGEIGILVAGCEREDFPTQTERLILGVAANQAALGLHQARLLSQQKRIAGELDRRVAERTRELAEINEELQLQVGLLQRLPVSAWTLKPDGTPDFVNQVWLEFSGQSLDFVRSHPEAWMSAVHPEDRERAAKTFWDGIRSGKDFAVETRSLRASDGTYRWHLQQAVALRDAEGKILRFVGTTTDIDDQKRAEEELRASETNLRRVIDAIPTLSWCALPDGPNVFLSKGWYEYTGFSTDEALGWGWQAAYHPEDRQRVDEHFRRMLASGEPGDIEARLRRWDGAYRWFLMRAAPFRDEAGTILRWYGTSTDIHDRKLAEEALRDSEIGLRQTLDTIPGLVSKANSSGMIELANRQLLKYFGKTIEEMNSWSTGNVVHPDDLPRVTAEITHSFKTGTPFDSELRYRRADGVHRWFQARSLPFHGADGEVAGWYFLLTDIEDRKRIEEELRSSEGKLRRVIDTIPSLSWCNLPDGPNEFLSKGWHEYTGLSPEEAHGWGWTAAFHADDLPPLMKRWQELLISGEPGEIEARIRRHDGVYRWFLVRVAPFRDDNGAILRWYGTSTDIEDRKRAEEAVLASERNLNLIINTMPVLAWTASPNGHADFFNQRWLDYTGLTQSDAHVWGWANAFHPDDLVRVIDDWRSHILSGEPGEIEARLRRHDGIYRWFLLRENPLRDESGAVIKWYGTNTDIDDRKRAEDELTRARAELAHVARVTSLGAFTASMAHEVNQPLSGIVTNASTCLRMLDSSPPNIEGARETARRTIRDGNRASEVVTRLRALFKRKEIADEWINLNEAAREVIALSLSELQTNRIMVRQDFAENLPAVKGDRIQLQQVILNLLRNASDAMRDIDDRPRQLLIKTENEGGRNVQLTVCDSGIGFAPDAADRLFESFYTTKDDGMGIGLSVSRSIIEAHRGRLWASVNDGPGSSFAFSIPHAYDT